MNRVPAVLLVLLAACPARRPSAPPVVDAGRTAPTTVAAAATPPAHDPAHPPIDCPLRRHGLDPHHLQPFADTEQYIAHLERADRAPWQRPDEVVAALGLTGRETVVDLGAGSGYFSFRFARALPQGRVVALDVSPEMVRHVHHRAMTEGVRNLQADLAAADDPRVPPGADLVFLCDVLHHVADRPAWLARLFSEMRSGARLALIEFKEGPLPQGPPEAMKIPLAQLQQLLAQAGFVADSSRPDLLPYQHFLVLRRP